MTIEPKLIQEIKPINRSQNEGKSARDHQFEDSSPQNNSKVEKQKTIPVLVIIVTLIIFVVLLMLSVYSYLKSK
ncbi:MAG: hypothetical protein M1554_02725 [Patescibacteria group bacterium]|jgi:lipopolysaccharide/colanic/teichoic acid biosynthesis glycosyltransferase|nr:hypothetical protein [Patescibacteria group bacterium]